MTAPRRSPLVSIVLPTYNGLPYLRQAIQSVFAQTYPNWELIVVDDGSTDGTAAWVSGLNSASVCLLDEPHRGNPGRCRNRGLSRAGGDYVAFLDSDDVWLPDKLAQQVDDLERHPECGWSYTFVRQIDAAGREHPLPKGRGGREYRGWILPQLITLEAVVTTPSVLVRRALLLDVGGFDEGFRFCGDYELWMRLAERAKVTVVPEAFVLVRNHAGSHTRWRVDVLETWVRLYRSITERHREVRIRGLARSQCGVHLRSLARYHRQGNRTRSSLWALLREVRYRPPTPAWGVDLGKTLLRPVVPRALLGWYYRSRDAAPDV